MAEKMSILASKYEKLSSWLDNIREKHGEDSTLSLSKLREMMMLLDSMESKMDKIILDAFKETLDGT